MTTDKRFSVFISSTFEDLREERQAVQDAVLSAGDFPVQMETFPAVDQAQFDFIKSLIDKCDYYILIVAGRYGTPDKDGISYTEKEYHYAKSQNTPVLVMLHESPGNISVNRTEGTDEGRERLAKFKSEVSTDRLVKKWLTAGDLKHAVRDALDNAKATRPGIGWVRGDTTASAELLGEINEVRKENAKYRKAIGQLETALALPPLPNADDRIEVPLLPLSNGVAAGTYARIKCTWISAFPIFFNALACSYGNWTDEEPYYVNRDLSCRQIGAAFAAELAVIKTDSFYCISSNTFDRLRSYYVEAGLMNSGGNKPFTDAGERAARRFRIAASGPEEFSIIEGEVAVQMKSGVVGLGQPSDGDDIPF